MAFTYPQSRPIRENAYRYMFQCWPSSAFDVMAFHDRSVLQDRRQLLIFKDQAEVAVAKCRMVAGKSDPNEAALVDDATRAMSPLIKRKEWWCKLYVAETLARNKDIFKNHDAFPELKDEKHPWIREALDKPFSGIQYRREAKNDFR